MCSLHGYSVVSFTSYSSYQQQHLDRVGVADRICTLVDISNGQSIFNVSLITGVCISDTLL